MRHVYKKGRYPFHLMKHFVIDKNMAAMILGRYVTAINNLYGRR